MKGTKRTPHPHMLCECLSVNCPCGNNILLRVQRPLAVIRPRRASRCDRGTGGVVEQREPHVNEHLHLSAVVS